MGWSEENPFIALASFQYEYISQDYKLGQPRKSKEFFHRVGNYGNLSILNTGTNCAFAEWNS
jgi:hypothetical protein